MTQLEKLRQMLPAGEEILTHVGAWRLDEDGEHFGWLHLLETMIVFLDDRDEQAYNDVVQLSQFRAAGISDDDNTGVLTMEWENQTTRYRGSIIELRAFIESVDGLLPNP